MSMLGQKCAWNSEAKRAKRSKKSGDEDMIMVITSGRPTSYCTSYRFRMPLWSLQMLMIVIPKARAGQAMVLH
jgi:hypothetical protein